MLHLLLAILLSHGGFLAERLGAQGSVGRVLGGVADRVITLKVTSNEDKEDSAGSSDERCAVSAARTSSFNGIILPELPLLATSWRQI